MDEKIETKEILLGLLQMLDEGKLMDVEVNLQSAGFDHNVGSLLRKPRFSLQLRVSSDEMFHIRGWISPAEYEQFAERQLTYWMSIVRPDIKLEVKKT